MSAFHITPQAIEDLFTERLAANGIRQVRISDCSNMVASWRQQVEQARHRGLGTIVDLIYSLSPKHTDAYYAQRARDAAALRPARICIKDPGGLLTPERTRTLVPAVLSNADGLPVEFHTHCITGLGPLFCLEAIKLGIKSVNTAIPPLADASSIRRCSTSSRMRARWGTRRPSMQRTWRPSRRISTPLHGVKACRSELRPRMTANRFPSGARRNDREPSPPALHDGIASQTEGCLAGNGPRRPNSVTPSWSLPTPSSWEPRR